MTKILRPCPFCDKKPDICQSRDYLSNNYIIAIKCCDVEFRVQTDRRDPDQNSQFEYAYRRLKDRWNKHAEDAKVTK